MSIRNETSAEYRLSHWAQVVQDRIESGLSVKAFCEKTGIHGNSLYYWQRKLREAACNDLTEAGSGAAGLEQPVFAEVKVAPKEPLLLMPGDINGQVCVETRGLRITAGSGYPAEKLAYLIRAAVQPC